MAEIGFLLRFLPIREASIWGCTRIYQTVSELMFSETRIQPFKYFSLPGHSGCSTIHVPGGNFPPPPPGSLLCTLVVTDPRHHP